MKDHEIEGAREAMRRKLNDLMDWGARVLQDNDGMKPGLYPLSAHLYLQEHAGELLFPLEKEDWPDNFRNLAYPEAMRWPECTMYCYITDVLAPPLVPYILLHFGYAVFENKLAACTFFVVQKKVGYQETSQGMVIDPLALKGKEKPSFYVGCPVGEKDIRDFHSLNNRGKNPLELHVMRKAEEEHGKELHDLYMEKYILQATQTPTWFPQELIRFTRKNELEVPEQAKRA